ncbi:hypothetical protein HHA04nite_10880 [Halomonas halophila]|uniref:Uncharacterized protein n=1 Tax=Halomonas halophila TaxID=29573 RepID=A0ABQ0U6A7_9GAMM|nr:hypothetical protein HHA04nite_10880 [Halomonas halophila]
MSCCASSHGSSRFIGTVPGTLLARPGGTVSKKDHAWPLPDIVDIDGTDDALSGHVSRKGILLDRAYSICLLPTWRVRPRDPSIGKGSTVLIGVSRRVWTRVAAGIGPGHSHRRAFPPDTQRGRRPAADAPVRWRTRSG